MPNRTEGFPWNRTVWTSHTSAITLFVLETLLNSCPVGEQMSQSTSTLKETTCKVRMRLLSVQFLMVKSCQWFAIKSLTFYVKRIGAGRDPYHEVRSAKVGWFTSWLIRQLWYVCHNIGSSVNSLEEGYAMWTYVASLPHRHDWESTLFDSKSRKCDA